jgi:hypothetical protein
MNRQYLSKTICTLVCTILAERGERHGAPVVAKLGNIFFLRVFGSKSCGADDLAILSN